MPGQDCGGLNEATSYFIFWEIETNKFEENIVDMQKGK